MSRDDHELPMAGAAAPERGDAARNRERVLDAARRLFAERDPATVSMDEIAAAAGVGKGTVFRRFGDRAGLTVALIDEDMRRFQEAFLAGPPPLGPGAPAAQRIEAFVLGLLELQRAKLPFVLAAARGAVAPPGVARALGTHLATLIAELRDDVDPEVAAVLLLSAVSPPAIALARSLAGEGSDLAGTVRVLLRGLLRDQGPA